LLFSPGVSNLRAMDLQEQARLQTIIRKDRADIVRLKALLAAADSRAADLERENVHLRETLEKGGLSPADVQLLREQAAWDAKHPRQRKRA
jgi:hypothetical protein